MKYIKLILLFVVVIGIGLLRGFNKSSVERKTLDAYIKCGNYRNQATQIINKDSGAIMPSSDAEKMHKYHRMALAEAKKVDIDFLNRKYPDWGTQFEENCLAGLTLVVDGHNKNDASTSIEGQMKLQSWVDWHNLHVEEIRKLGSK